MLQIRTELSNGSFCIVANGKSIYVGGTTLTRTFMLVIFARLHKCNVRRSFYYAHQFQRR